MNDEETAAKKVALTNILVRNQDVLQWYIAKMFEHMPPMYVKVMFKAFSMIDKEGRITQESMWMLIPAFISSLPTEHFAVFLDHMGGFAECLHNEYEQYIIANTSTNAKTSAIEPVSPSGSTHDIDGTNGQWQDDSRKYHLAQSDDGAVSRSDTGYERGGFVLPSVTQTQTLSDQS